MPKNLLQLVNQLAITFMANGTTQVNIVNVSHFTLQVKIRLKNFYVCQVMFVGAHLSVCLLVCFCLG